MLKHLDYTCLRGVIKGIKGGYAMIDTAEKQIVDEAIYRCYAFNRLHDPEIPAERWAKVFNKAAELEAKFQAQFKNEAQHE